MNPSVSLYEVFKRVWLQRGENKALKAVALMQQGSIIDLTTLISPNSARVSVKEKLPMVDRILFATARTYKATSWRQDSDFCLQCQSERYREEEKGPMSLVAGRSVRPTIFPVGYVTFSPT